MTIWGNKNLTLKAKAKEPLSQGQTFALLSYSEAHEYNAFFQNNQWKDQLPAICGEEIWAVLEMPSTGSKHGSLWRSNADETRSMLAHGTSVEAPSCSTSPRSAS